MGRTIAGIVIGFVFGVFLAFDLFLFGVVGLQSVVLTIVVVASLVLGGGLGFLASRRSRAGSSGPSAPPAATVPNTSG